MNGLYNVKSEYWVTRNILIKEPDDVNSESSIAQLYTFVWKVKIHQILWQVISGDLGKHEFNTSSYEISSSLSGPALRFWKL